MYTEGQVLSTWPTWGYPTTRPTQCIFSTQSAHHAQCHARVPSRKRPFNLGLGKKIEKDQLYRLKSIYQETHTNPQI